MTKWVSLKKRAQQFETQLFATYAASLSSGRALLAYSHSRFDESSMLKYRTMCLIFVSKRSG